MCTAPVSFQINLFTLSLPRQMKGYALIRKAIPPYQIGYAYRSNSNPVSSAAYTPSASIVFGTVRYLPYRAVPEVRNGSVRYCTVPYGTVRSGTGTVPDGTVPYGTRYQVPYGTVPVRYHTVREGPAALSNLMVRCEKPHVNKAVLSVYEIVYKQLFNKQLFTSL